MRASGKEFVAWLQNPPLMAVALVAGLGLGSPVGAQDEPAAPPETAADAASSAAAAGIEAAEPDTGAAATEPGPGEATAALEPPAGDEPAAAENPASLPAEAPQATTQDAANAPAADLDLTPSKDGADPPAAVAGITGGDAGVAATGTATGDEPADAESGESAPAEADQASAEGAAPAASASDPIREYLDAIERTEALNSAYSSELADLYLGLGQHHLERQEYDEARKAFMRGQQIVRVNNGLYAPEQTYYMFSLADIESRMGESDIAEEILRNIYTINARAFGHASADMLPVLSQMLNWYTARNQLYGSGSRYGNMVKAERITSEMAHIIENINGLAHPDTARIYRRLGQLNFHLADELTRYGYEDAPTVSFSSSLSSRSSGATPSVKTHFTQGRDAFTKFAESVNQDASRTPLERADAYAQLGDWYLVFDKPRTAGETYARAFDILQEVDRSRKLVDDYFGAPKPLDFMDIPQYNPEVQQELAGELLEVSMTITRNGRVRDLEILQMPGDLDEEQERQLRKELSGLRFRPRVVAGLPETTDHFVWQYPTSPGQTGP
jgi:tetratricopeptide (TPR) repeat protein